MNEIEEELMELKDEKIKGLKAEDNEFEAEMSSEKEFNEFKAGAIHEEKFKSRLKYIK